MFTKPRLSVKVNNKVRWKITQTIIEAELNNKYKKLKLLKQQEKETDTAIKEVIVCTVNRGNFGLEVTLAT